jgi:dCMP deaminase
MKDYSMLSYFKHPDQPTAWDEMFFSNAVLWSRKSHDIETQCGCVIVKNKTVIATGYNGFMRDIDDLALPNTRPAKYPFMLHAEENAIYNAAREGQSTVGSRIYITAAPCKKCLQMLWQCGIHEIYFSDLSAPKNGMWGEDYELILKQIQSRINFKFFPRESLSNLYLLEATKKF